LNDEKPDGRDDSGYALNHFENPDSSGSNPDGQDGKQDLQDYPDSTPKKSCKSQKSPKIPVQKRKFFTE
jgi:hypothetical protein